MKLMLCTHPKDAEHFIRRIRAVDDDFIVADLYSPAALLRLPAPFDSDALWIAIDGAAGMEAVIDAKERDPTIPLIWMSEDPLFSTVAYNLKVAWFLNKNCTEQELADALRDARQGRRWPYAYCAVL